MQNGFKSKKWWIVGGVAVILLLVFVFHGRGALVTREELDESKYLAEQWLVDNLNDKGIFNYIYRVSDSSYDSSNNMIRQLMASRLLAEMASEKPLFETFYGETVNLLDLHRKNLDFIFSTWYMEEDGLGYIYYNNRSKLGAIAMALRTLVYSPYFDEYQDQARALLAAILSLQHEDGSFEPWFKDPGTDQDKDYLLAFYSGEALLALTEYYMKTGDQDVLDAAVLGQDFYVKRYVDQIDQYYYPAYVPWHTQSLNKLYQITGNGNYAKSIFILNDKLLELQNVDEDSEFYGRFYNPSTPQYGTPHSASDGVYVEGLVYAYEIAEVTGDKEHQDLYREAILRGLHNLIGLQYQSDERGDYAYFSRLEGAIRYKLGDDRIRIDTTQHTLDAYRKTYEMGDIVL